MSVTFDDLAIGAVYETARITVTEDSIIRFALEWDPQPFHIDRLAAEESIFGSLIGSGLQTLLLSYRLYFDQGLIKNIALAGLGIDELRFLGPLTPGDTIRVRIIVIEARHSSKPGRGIVRLMLETLTQADKIILTFFLNALVATETDFPQLSR